MRTKGAVEFTEKFPGPVAELADRFGVSVGTISAWRSGARLPVGAKRQVIASAGGPLPVKWDEPLPACPTIVLGAAEPGSGTPEAAVTLADEHLHHCRALKAELMLGTGGLDLKSKLSAAEKLTGMIIGLGKLTGASITDERQILRSPYFAQVIDKILRTLDPWPDALSAVVTMCEDIRTGGG